MKTTFIAKLIVTMILVAASGAIAFAADPPTNTVRPIGNQWFCSTATRPWQARDAGALRRHRRYPDLKLVQTQSECGNGSFDWNAAEHTLDLINYYLSQGVLIYDCWNLVLDESGRSYWGWKQNALITVNQKDGTVTQTPEYWLFKHFSNEVIPGSVRIPCEGEFPDVIAFRRPDGKLVLVAANMRGYMYQLSARIGRNYLQANLPVRSFNTFILDNTQGLK